MVAKINIELRATDNASSVINRINASLSNLELLAKRLKLSDTFLGVNRPFFPEMIFPAKIPTQTPVEASRQFIEMMERLNIKARYRLTKEEVASGVAFGEQMYALNLLGIKRAYQEVMSQIPEMRFERTLRQELNRIMEDNRGKMLFLGLSVMFAGMAVNRYMGNLLQPAMELAGVFEIINAILVILFLPIVLKLIPVLLSVLDFVSKLDDRFKLLIGAVVVLVGVLGFFGMVLGQLLTLMAGLTMLSGGIAGASAFVASTAAGVGAAVGAGATAATKTLAPLAPVALGGAGLVLSHELLPKERGNVEERRRAFLEGIMGQGPHTEFLLYGSNAIGRFAQFLRDLLFGAPTPVTETKVEQHINVNNNFYPSSAPNTHAGYDVPTGLNIIGG